MSAELADVLGGMGVVHEGVGKTNHFLFLWPMQRVGRQLFCFGFSLQDLFRLLKCIAFISRLIQTPYFNQAIKNNEKGNISLPINRTNDGSKP